MVGLLVSSYASYLFNLVPPIPYKWFPDLRLAFLLLSGSFIGLQAMGGSARRRGFALWGVVGYVLAWHLEQATVHWIGPIPGSITGSRVGIGLGGTLLMLVAIVLMHIEVERVKLRADVIARGAPDASADELSEGLAAEGRRQVWGIAAGIAGLAVFIFVAEKAFGDTASGGGWTLMLGGGLLLVLALYLLRLVPGSGAPSR